MSIKQALATAALAAGFTASALAADLPRRAYADPYLAPVPVFSWTGFYAGANVGGAFGNHGGALRPDFTTSSPIGDSRDDAGFIGGGQVGYNMQMGQLVYGIEADADYLGLGNSGTFSTSTTVGTTNGVFQANRDSGDGFLGTVRGRIGYAFLPRLMAYGTGGLAYGQIGSAYTGATFTSNSGAITNYTTSNNDDIRVGYALGVGLEYAFTNNLSAKLEYLYADLGRKDYVLTDIKSGGIITARSSGEAQIARVGLNYRF